MRRRSFLQTCCVLFVGTLASAQSGASDLSGTWAGELTPTGSTTSRPVTLELEADRDGRVTGTMTGMPSPADVKAGTFDARTGALKLELGRTGDATVLMVLEGTAVKGTATGKVTITDAAGGGGGDFKLTKKP